MSPAISFKLEAQVKEWWIKGRALIQAQKEPVGASGAQADIAQQVVHRLDVGYVSGACCQEVGCKHQGTQRLRSSQA